MKITDEERAMLTEEELAGMEEGQDFDEGQGDTEAKGDTNTGTTGADESPIVVNDDGEGEGDEGEGEGDGAGEANDKPEGGKKADEGTNDEAAAGRDDGEDAPTAPQRTYATLPDDYDDQVAKIQTDKDALVAKFDEGDISMAEYHKELDALNRNERELERLKDRVEYDTRARYDHWVNVDVASFMSEHPQYKENPMLAGLLDQEVRKLQIQADNDTDPAILAQAHKAISAALPAMFDAPAAKDDTPATKAKPAAARKHVPTLAGVPAADVDQPGAGKFDALDRLYESDPIAAEAAFDRLSPAEQNEYLAS